MRVLVAPRLERRGVLAAFTERGGGVSDPPFHSLNLGFRTGDDLQRVRRNRHRMVEALGIPPFSTARHVHGTELVRVTKVGAGAGFEDPATALGEADAVATDLPGLPVAVLVADCLPIVLVADDLLVLVHAGWRGLAAGILATAASELGDPSAASAAIGPAIGPCHYEVGPEVVDAVDRGSPGGAVVERRDGRMALDLEATASRALAASGVSDIEVMGGCTACQPERFFSHRRDGRTGRHVMVAMRQ
ncbi:MAG: polyphenol oxidase family protein [Actinomycetota bacterium]